MYSLVISSIPKFALSHSANRISYRVYNLNCSNVLSTVAHASRFAARLDPSSSSSCHVWRCHITNACRVVHHRSFSFPPSGNNNRLWNKVVPTEIMADTCVHWWCISLILSSDGNRDIEYFIFKDYGLCRGSKVVDYSEDPESLALEGSYLIWKSHMITGDWDLFLWLPKELR